MNENRLSTTRFAIASRVTVEAEPSRGRRHPFLDAGTEELAIAILKAAGAEEVITINRYAHLVGGSRMAARPSDGVVDSEHRVFGVPNLYVVDGSVLPTQGAANPALTIMALAARAAARLIAVGRRGLTERAAVGS